MSSHLVDIGINLAHRSFDRDRAAVIERAAAAGVTTIVVTGTSVEASRVQQMGPG
jgi:TatD DNase family protein